MSDTNPPLTSFIHQRNSIHRELRALSLSFRSQVDPITLQEMAEGLSDLANRVETLKAFANQETTSLCFKVKCNRITTYLIDYSELVRTHPDRWREVTDVLDMVLIQVGRLTLTGDDSDDDLAQDAEMLAEDKEISLLPREEDEAASQKRRHMYGLWCQLTYNTVAGCGCKGCREDLEWNELDEIEGSSENGNEDEDEEMLELSGSSRSVLRVTNPGY